MTTSRGSVIEIDADRADRLKIDSCNYIRKNSGVNVFEIMTNTVRMKPLQTVSVNAIITALKVCNNGNLKVLFYESTRVHFDKFKAKN